MGPISPRTEKTITSLKEISNPNVCPLELRDLVENDVAAVAEQVLWGSVLFRKTY